jgi:hypothetical protein
MSVSWPVSNYGERALIDVAPFREAFEASGVTAYQVALRMGWFEGGAVDSYRVRQTLGLVPYNPGHGYPLRHRAYVTPAIALRLVDAMGLLPAEVGL